LCPRQNMLSLFLSLFLSSSALAKDPTTYITTKQTVQGMQFCEGPCDPTLPVEQRVGCYPNPRCPERWVLVGNYTASEGFAEFATDPLQNPWLVDCIMYAICVPPIQLNSPVQNRIVAASSVIEQLEKLAELKKTGMLSDIEFSAAKTALLGVLNGSMSEH